MRKWLIGLLLALNSICLVDGKDSSSQDGDWLAKAQKVDEEAVKWLKEHLKERLASENLLRNPLEDNSELASIKNCQGCNSENWISEASFSIYVFMSFSLEDDLWMQFSKELEKMGGTFVLRGLPQNSFKELANRIFDLQEKGVNAPIQIHPHLFQECDVQLVPTIAVIDGNQYDKISGNLSVKYALEKMAKQGETNQAKVLYQQYKLQEKQ